MSQAFTHKFKRTERLNEQLREMISLLLLTQVKDPRVQGVTITRVETADDLQNAKIFFRLLTTQNADAATVQNTIRGLDHVTGFIRHHLGKEMHIKRIPHFHFSYDLKVDEEYRFEKLLSQITQELKESAAVEAPVEETPAEIQP